jgi:hypothetical protein
MKRTLVWLRAVAVVLASRATAQQVQGSVTISGGSATDVAGNTSRALTVSPTLSFIPDSRLAFGLGATGTRYDDQRWSVGGQASAAGRLALGSHVAATLNADGGTTTTSYEFSYVTTHLLPGVEASAGPVTAYAGVTAAVANTRLTRAIPGAPGLFGETPLGSSSVTTASRSSHGVVFGGNARFADVNGQSFVLGVRQQQTAVDTISSLDRTASVSTSSGRLIVGGTFGVRSERGVNATFGSGALTVAIDTRLAIQVSAGSYPVDHLIGTPGGRFLTLGLSLTTGRAERRLPSASGVPAPAAGLTRLTIRMPDARRVDVAGDFSSWKPIAATRAPNGVWFVDLRVPSGQYRYAFRIDETAWAVPDGTAAVDDGFGGKSAWLTVSDAPTGSAR